eukprot:6402342-Amphidinium_carterae.1
MFPIMYADTGAGLSNFSMVLSGTVKAPAGKKGKQSRKMCRELMSFEELAMVGPKCIEDGRIIGTLWSVLSYLGFATAGELEVDASSVEELSYRTLLKSAAVPGVAVVFAWIPIAAEAVWRVNAGGAVITTLLLQSAWMAFCLSIGVPLFKTGRHIVATGYIV